jgi:hypothetical protein
VAKFRASHVFSRAGGSACWLEVGDAEHFAKLVIVRRSSKSALAPVEHTHDVVNFIWVVIAGTSAVLVERNAAVLSGSRNLVSLDGRTLAARKLRYFLVLVFLQRRNRRIGARARRVVDRKHYIEQVKLKGLLSYTTCKCVREDCKNLSCPFFRPCIGQVQDSNGRGADGSNCCVRRLCCTYHDRLRRCPRGSP